MSDARSATYSTCPKCGYVRTREDQVSPEECPACGIIYRKWLEHLATESRTVIVHHRRPAGSLRTRLARILLAHRRQPGRLEFGFYLLVLAGLLMMLWRKLDAARHEPTPPKLGACVGAGIRGEALLMCGFALMLAHDRPWWGLLALAMYPVGALLSTWISPT